MDNDGTLKRGRGSGKNAITFIQVGRGTMMALSNGGGAAGKMPLHSYRWVGGQ